MCLRYKTYRFGKVKVIEMSNWEDNVRKVVPYVAGEQPKSKDVIKLNTNECPYPPSPRVKDALENLDIDILRKYPESDVGSLRAALAKRYEIDEDQVFVGVGSDDVLAMSFLTFFNSDKPILFPDITYSFYDVWADLFKIPYECQPLDESFYIKKEDYYKANGGVVIANPNAPTGVMLPLDDIEDIIKANQDVIVIVDEAYVDFGGVSARPLVDRYENVLVVQTFSKSRAMAGMRIGYAFGSKKLIGYLNDAKYSFNSYTMNTAAIETGVACVEDEEYFRQTVAKVVDTRERTKRELARLGFTFPDSKTNFIFAKHESAKAEDIFMALRGENIFVRHWNKPRISDYLRISIGTDKEMDALIAFLEDYLK